MQQGWPSVLGFCLICIHCYCVTDTCVWIPTCHRVLHSFYHHMCSVFVMAGPSDQSYYYYVLFLFYKTGSQVVQAVFNMSPRIILNFWYSCLYLPSAGYYFCYCWSLFALFFNLFVYNCMCLSAFPALNAPCACSASQRKSKEDLWSPGTGVPGNCGHSFVLLFETGSCYIPHTDHRPK